MNSSEDHKPSKGNNHQHDETSNVRKTHNMSLVKEQLLIKPDDTREGEGLFTPMIEVQPKTSKTSTVQNASLGTLGRLPLELRWQIYLEVMAEAGNDEFAENAQSKQVLTIGVEEPTKDRRWCPPAISRISQQLRDETLPIFCKKHVFRVILFNLEGCRMVDKALAHLAACRQGLVLDSVQIVYLDDPRLHEAHQWYLLFRTLYQCAYSLGKRRQTCPNVSFEVRQEGISRRNRNSVPVGLWENMLRITSEYDLKEDQAFSHLRSTVWTEESIEPFS